jgi:hypothetical protein
MPHDKGPSPRALVQPNREALLTLRDRYMRQMEASSYDEVRNKFLEELHSKGSSPSALPRERGAGIWNKAFASTPQGKMLRSSIILLAEFFDVEPEELIFKEGEQAPPPPGGPTAITTVGCIYSEAGVHLQGTISQKTIIHSGVISSIARETVRRTRARASARRRSS